MGDKDNTVMWYDEDADVLYVTIGDPRPAVTEEVMEGVFVRLDPETGEPCGMTVVGYKEAYRDLRQLKKKLMQCARIFEQITSADLQEPLLTPSPRPA